MPISRISNASSISIKKTDPHDGFGRYYNYPSAEWLSELLTKGGWRNITISESDRGGYDGKPTRWLVVGAQR